MITEWLIKNRPMGQRFFRWIAKFWRHCEVHPKAIIGNNFRVGHGGFGVVIGNCWIGDNVTIMQGTTIGNNPRLPMNLPLSSMDEDYPMINDNVFIGSNCDIIGGIFIGRKSIIGAGSVITKNIPANSIAYNKRELIINTREQNAETN